MNFPVNPAQGNTSIIQFLKENQKEIIASYWNHEEMFFFAWKYENTYLRWGNIPIILRAVNIYLLLSFFLIIGTYYSVSEF